MASGQVQRLPSYDNRLPAAYVADLNDLAAGPPILCRFNANTSNIPVSGRNGCCLHFASSSSYAVQMALAVGLSVIYVRNKSNGTWSSWTQIP